MLPRVFDWLDYHPTVYWVIAVAGTLVLAAWIAAGFRPARTGTPAGRPAWIFGLLLFLFLLAWRWPFLLCAKEYNPDESQFIAGALTLSHDPVFWRAVDGTTSGPLNFYALLPLHGLGLPLDYFTARLTGLLLSWAVLFLLYGFFRRRSSAGLAMLAVLPGAVFFATAAEPDFVHYSSELVPLMLLGLAIAWSARHPLGAAFVAGLLPWTKLQALPLGGVLGLWLLVQAWLESPPGDGPAWRRWAALCGCALAPTAAIIGLAAIFGQLEPLYRRYVEANFIYVAEGLPWRETVRRLWHQAVLTQHFPLFALGGGLSLLIAVAVYVMNRRRPSALFWLGVSLLPATLLAVVLPGRPSLHYVLFFTVPVMLATGAALCDLWPVARARRGLAFVTVAAALLPLGWRTGAGAPDMFGHFAQHWRQPYSPLGSLLRYWRQPGARLTIWGWLCSPHVESGLPQGTRDVLTAWGQTSPALIDYYRRAYLADLRHNRPELFVDSVGAGAPIASSQAMPPHEGFPALADYLQANYRLVAEIPPARVYVRSDYLAAHPLGRKERQRLLARGRLEYGDGAAPDGVAPGPASFTEVGHTSVQMIEPPTTLTWHLTGSERRIALRFGMHPRSYHEGTTNGAVFIVELRVPGQPPLEIYRRALDPRRNPDDRGPQAAELPLPPLAPGTDLVVRTTPGENGDAAWDWVYLESLRFLRFPDYLASQFPGFTRVPDEVLSPHAALIEHEQEGHYLSIHPPAVLTFVLDGSEGSLEFDFGLEAGAYGRGGQTDGALYQVELLQNQAAPRLLFARRLDPVREEADRGRQHASVRLPGDVREGDRLVLRIGAGANASWDWTYLAELKLR